MTAIAEAFPWVLTVMLIIVIIAAIRLATSRSQGSIGAGPLLTPEGAVPGLSATAWDLAAIEQTLTESPANTLATLRNVARANAVDVPPSTGSVQLDIDRLLTLLETELGIT